MQMFARPQKNGRAKDQVHNDKMMVLLDKYIYGFLSKVFKKYWMVSNGLSYSNYN